MVLTLMCIVYIVAHNMYTKYYFRIVYGSDVFIVLVIIGFTQVCIAGDYV